MSAIVAIKLAPRRMLNLREAADYCGVSRKQFTMLSGIAPVAMPHGHKLYDIKDLDAWLDALKNNAPDGHEAILARLGK